jgi:hypothetical protein
MSVLEGKSAVEEAGLGNMAEEYRVGQKKERSSQAGLSPGKWGF